MAPTAPIDTSEKLDRRHMLMLSILVIAVVISAVDTSVLNVAIPTMLHDLHTTVPSLEWVITGYSLTFAAFLMIGGRLGDIYGHRRMFVAGTMLFGTGSLIAAVAPSVGWLIVGEAIIEGIGGSLMVPATLALMSTNFRGQARITAFAVWGATIGAAVAFGPLVGGFLTTNYSWRWAFGINVIVCPVAATGAMLFIPRSARKERVPIDAPGAAMAATGAFLLVFALSQAGEYGWWTPLRAFHVGSATVWPESAPISIAPTAIALGAVFLAGFVLHERRKEHLGTHPLFEFSQLRLKTFRYGLTAAVFFAISQLGLLFALALFLQGAMHLSAMENGLWLVPMGLSVMVGAQISGRLARRITPTSIARLGLLIQAVAYAVMVLELDTDITFGRLAPGLVVFGIGIGFASSQLTSVVLSEIAIDKSGVASGANSTARQIGSALGAALVGAIITTRTASHAMDMLPGSGLSQAAQAKLAATVHAMGPNAVVPPGLSPAEASTAQHVLARSLLEGTRWSLWFDGAAVALGAGLSLLIPRIRVQSAHTALEVLETFDDLEPAIADPREILGPEPAGGTRP